MIIMNMFYLYVIVYVHSQELVAVQHLNLLASDAKGAFPAPPIDQPQQIGWLTLSWR